jgi:hypothetical protein
MVITIEPGIYFIEKLIEGSKTKEISKFINYDIL